MCSEQSGGKTGRRESGSGIHCGTERWLCIMHYYTSMHESAALCSCSRSLVVSVPSVPWSGPHHSARFPPEFLGSGEMLPVQVGHGSLHHTYKGRCPLPYSTLQPAYRSLYQSLDLISIFILNSQWPPSSLASLSTPPPSTLASRN